MLRSVAIALSAGLLLWSAITLHGCHRKAVAEAAAHAEARAAAHAQAATNWEAQATIAIADAAECAAKWSEAQTSADRLRLDQARADAEREAERAAWEARWAARSQSCGAALLDMQTACESEIGSY
jgi:hypothetical protein